MTLAESFLEHQLEERAQNGLLRKLSTSFPSYDFCSNDYLGLARSEELRKMVAAQSIYMTENQLGSSGSRLLSGNSIYTEETEQLIANFHQAAAGLIFNSGYDANLGLLSSIPQRGDTIITDELIHASLIDGARLSYAERHKFMHNDIYDLEKKLKLAKGLIYVVVESVYSMDGDLAPLTEISAICEKYKANLIVDEAHATGVFGDNGSGLVAKLKLTAKVFARVVTFGKALGTHGAIVLGSNNLRNYLINFARSFIYTTAAPPHAIVAVNCAYQLLARSDAQQKILLAKIELYNQLTNDIAHSKIKSSSAIQTLLTPGNSFAKKVAKKLQDAGFDVRPILSPTVPPGKERLRICLHSFNSDQEIVKLTNLLKQI
jgi:8-amino-7-oxononanoate synthase